MTTKRNGTMTAKSRRRTRPKAGKEFDPDRKIYFNAFDAPQSRSEAERLRSGTGGNRGGAAPTLSWNDVKRWRRACDWIRLACPPIYDFYDELPTVVAENEAIDAILAYDAAIATIELGIASGDDFNGALGHAAFVLKRIRPKLHSRRWRDQKWRLGEREFLDRGGETELRIETGQHGEDPQMAQNARRRFFAA